MALVGYARVSSVGLSLDVQLDKLQHCDKTFQEKKSGASGKRLQLEVCLDPQRGRGRVPHHRCPTKSTAFYTPLAAPL